MGGDASGHDGRVSSANAVLGLARHELHAYFKVMPIQP